MIGIRADANEFIASGHVMRCMAIARQIKALNEPCMFLVSDQVSASLVEKFDFEVKVLSSKWNDMNQEIDKMISMIKEYGITSLLIDSYYVTKEYIEELKKYTRIIYMDDFGITDYKGHMLINYNLDWGRVNYEQHYKDVRLCLGKDYVPLRDEFREANYTPHKQMTDILITTGGGDSYNLSGQIVKKALETEAIKHCRFHIIVGKLNPHINMLEEMASQNKNIVLHKDVSSMAEVMCECDLALTAAGTTVLELTCVGLPFIAFSFASNQGGSASWLEENHYCTYVGNISDDLEQGVNEIVNEILKYTDDEYRIEQSERLKTLIDGFGAYNIAKAIVKEK